MTVKYDQIGLNYNQTRCADPFLTSRLIHLLQPDSSGKYLDIGCGTGNYTIAMANLGLQVIGMDPSIQMLNEAKQKRSNVEWCLGKAEKTGIDSHEIEGVIATLTLHHWDNLSKGFAEMARILKPNRRMVMFTATPQQMKGYWLNHYFPNMMEASIRQMPSLEVIEDAMKGADILIVKTEKYQVKPDLDDLFLYSGKYRPELYLNSQIRNGISSFTSLSNQEEVITGLKSLEQDILSGKIQEVMKSYSNNLGDYMFLVAAKK